MPLVAVGINHKTAPVEVREKVAFAPEQLVAAHRELLDSGRAEEAVIVSTCNRSELYCEVSSPEEGERLRHWLAEYHGVPRDQLAQCSYEFHELEVVNHLSRVAAGLDSLVLGEPQILGQLKSAYAVAQEAQSVASDLNRLFQHSFAVAKSVRTDTAIGRNPVSVAYAAVDLSSHLFSDLRQCTALLIGAGETIELVARHLRERGVQRILVANRTLQRAERLASQFGAEAILLGDIPERLADADIVISSTASQLPILGKGVVEKALRKRRHAPMFMLDIAVPRDIEPEVDQLRDAYLYTVDDLEQVIRDNVASREVAAAEADSLIVESVRAYAESQRERSTGDDIKVLRDSVQAMADREVAAAERRLANGDDPHEVINRLAHRLTNKWLHRPTAALREAGREGRQEHIQWIRELFALDSDSGAD